MRKKECSFNKCEGEAVAKGLCRGHLSQHYRGQTLRPLRKYPPRDPVVNGKKKCRECGKVKSVDDFYKTDKWKSDSTSLDCKPCYSKKVRDNQKRKK